MKYQYVILKESGTTSAFCAKQIKFRRVIAHSVMIENVKCRNMLVW